MFPADILPVPCPLLAICPSLTLSHDTLFSYWRPPFCILLPLLLYKSPIFSGAVFRTFHHRPFELVRPTAAASGGLLLLLLLVITEFPCPRITTSTRYYTPGCPCRRSVYTALPNPAWDVPSIRTTVPEMFHLHLAVLHQPVTVGYTPALFC